MTVLYLIAHLFSWEAFRNRDWSETIPFRL